MKFVTFSVSRNPARDCLTVGLRLFRLFLQISPLQHTPMHTKTNQWVSSTSGPCVQCIPAGRRHLRWGEIKLQMDPERSPRESSSWPCISTTKKRRPGRVRSSCWYACEQSKKMLCWRRGGLCDAVFSSARRGRAGVRKVGVREISRSAQRCSSTRCRVDWGIKTSLMAIYLRRRRSAMTPWRWSKDAKNADFGRVGCVNRASSEGRRYCVW